MLFSGRRSSQKSSAVGCSATGSVLGPPRNSQRQERLATSAEVDGRIVEQSRAKLQDHTLSDEQRQRNASIRKAGLEISTTSGPTPEALNARVANPHALTARAVASARADESERRDSLFVDPLAKRLAGAEGRGLGVSLVIERTRFMDDFLVAEYRKGIRQAVLLGAGMDARAFRLGLSEMEFFEIDQATIFDVKEPLLADVPLQAKSRQCLAARVEDSQLAEKLIAAGFDPKKPSAWVLEGLMMYLDPEQTSRMMVQVGRVAAPGSAVVHESLSASYKTAGIVYCGAKFTGFSDEYDKLWAQHAGFNTAEMLDFSAVSVDRSRRMLTVDRHRGMCTKEKLRGRVMMYFLTARKTA